MTLTEAPQPEKRWYDSDEAAAYTGFSPHYIRDAANTGRLKGYRSKPGPKGHWRFLAADLDAFVQGAALGPRSKRGA